MKLLERFAAVIVLTAVILLVYVVILVNYPYEPVTFLPGNCTTLKDSYEQGEQLTYAIKYIKRTNHSATVIRSFEDGIVYHVPTIQTNNPSGRHEFISASVAVPECLPPGEYTLNATIVFRMNPFREVLYTTKTNMFTVTKKAGNDC